MKKAILSAAWPYQQDKMQLPVPDLSAAIPFYKSILGFTLISQTDTPYKSAILERDGIQIGLSQNGGDPTQDGCFFAVDNVEAAFEEFKTSGLNQESPNYDLQKHGDTKWKVFFVVAPDGLCYCFGEKQTPDS